MDNQQHTNIDFKNHVVQILASSAPKSMTFYAVDSLVKIFEKYGLTTLDSNSLKLWIASMLMEGMKVNTVKRYAGRVHTIFNEWRGADVADPFGDIQYVFTPAYQLNDADVYYNLEMLKRLFVKNEASEDWKIVSIFFYLLYNPGLSLLDVAYATFENAPHYCVQIDEIVKSRDSSFGRKYLFDLNQSKVRPTKIFKELTEGLTSLMKSAGMRLVVGNVRDEITAIWIAAAIKCGVDICDILAIISAVPYRYRALTLIEKSEISEDRKHEIICQVADCINDNTPRWFVMKLRKGVSFDEIKDKIEKELPGRLSTMELYYPTYTKTKKVGRKVIKEQIPFVPDMLFFRTQYNKVRSLFAKIGDIAWCFKTSQFADSKYSVISHEEMTNFQRCVGQFTPDIWIELVSVNRLLSKGRMVRITGGMMKGYKGKIEDLNDDKGTRKFFLRVSSENALNWTVEVDEAFIEPLNP